MREIFYYLTYFLSDKLFLKLKFWIKTGKSLNLNNPKSYNEKIQWLKLYDRNPLYTKLVDKSEVKKYVSNIIGKEYIIPTIGVYDKFDDINFDKLPEKFVIKTTHDSGGIVICKDKEKFDIRKAKEKIEKSLKRNYYKLHREWPYKNVKRRIIIEEYIETVDGDLPDYKFFCFDGEVKYLFIAVDRPHDTKFNFYDLKFNQIDVKQHYPNFSRKIEKPVNFDKMIKICQRLCKNIPHVRVDLYNINGRIYFGEMTFYHFSGFEVFDPELYDYEFGKYIEISRIKK